MSSAEEENANLPPMIFIFQDRCNKMGTPEHNRVAVCSICRRTFITDITVHNWATCNACEHGDIRPLTGFINK